MPGAREARGVQRSDPFRLEAQMDSTDIRTRESGNGHATIEKATEAGTRLLDRVVEMVRERPGAAILCALGAGFLVGKLIRR
jgi:hypothetical protein